MTLIAAPATPGLWLDTSTLLTEAQAHEFMSSGYVGFALYVPLPNVSEAQKANDITAGQLAMLTSLGGQVLLVQHVRYPGWDPRAHSGAVDAAAAAEHALGAGYPLGAHIFCDHEGVDPGCPSVAAVQYLEGWSGRMPAYPYRAGLYVGYQQPLNADQLYLLSGIDSYWSDVAHRVVSVRGFAIKQGPETTVNGVRIDSDKVAPDLKGELPFVAARASDPQPTPPSDEEDS